MAKHDRQFWESASRNNITFADYYDRLVELAVSMFEYKNMPDTVNVRFLELSLLDTGKAIFFEDEVLGHLALKCSIQGSLNVYGEPNRRRAYAVNGYQRELDEKNSVIIWNNMLHKGCRRVLENFARRLWSLDRTIDINAGAQKTPVLIECDPSEELSMKNLYMQYEGNAPVIFARKELNVKGVSVLNTSAPYNADKLQQLKNQIWNEALTYLGISNTNQQKKERLITDEVIRSMGGTIASRYSRLEMRRVACEEINKMFGLNIECNYRDDFREADDEVMITGDTSDGKMVNQVVDLRTQ